MPDMLILSRRFAPLFSSQFLSAFNDHFLKTSLVFLILFGGVANGATLITLASAIFIGPFFFLSGLAGELADRYDKALLAQRLKAAEIATAVVAATGYFTRSVPILFVALAAFGVIASLFGPIKYGILPDHLKREELPAGNAMVEGATFVAILSGTIIAGLMAKGGGASLLICGTVIAISCCSWLCAQFIPPTGSGAPNLHIHANIFASTRHMLRHLGADPRLRWGAYVTSWFWLVGIVSLALLPPLVSVLIGGDEQTVTIYLAIFTVAVGVGSALAAIIARGRIELRTTLVGAVMMALFSLDMGLASGGMGTSLAGRPPSDVFATLFGLRIAIDLAGLAIGGGLFIVPAFAAVQSWADKDYRARTIAAVNVLNAAFMTGGTVLVAALQSFGATVSVLFIGVGVIGFAVTLMIWKTMPRGITSSDP